MLMFLLLKKSRQHYPTIQPKGMLKRRYEEEERLITVAFVIVIIFITINLALQFIFFYIVPDNLASTTFFFTFYDIIYTAINTVSFFSSTSLLFYRFK